MQPFRATDGDPDFLWLSTALELDSKRPGARSRIVLHRHDGSALGSNAAHALLCKHPHRAWLYVDDLLAFLRKTDAAEAAALTNSIALLSTLHAPISWEKGTIFFSSRLVWVEFVY